MRKFGLVALLVFSAGLIQAQISNIPGVGNSVIRTMKYENIKGSAYLYDAWNSGSIFNRDGVAFPNVMMKYDVYKDKIEINQENQVMEINAAEYPKFAFTFFEENSGKVVKHNFSNGFDIPGYTKSSYFDIVYQGSHTVLKKVKKTFGEENVSNYGTSDVQKIFLASTYYFVIDANGTVKEVKLSKKSLLEKFPQNKALIEKYAAERKIKFKTEDELIGLFEYIDGSAG